MKDITAIGEILIDLTQTGHNEAKVPLFAANPGGAFYVLSRTTSSAGRASSNAGSPMGWSIRCSSRDTASGAMVAKHMAERGYGRFLYIGEEQSAKYAGFRSALADLGHGDRVECTASSDSRQLSAFLETWAPRSCTGAANTPSTRYWRATVRYSRSRCTL